MERFVLEFAIRSSLIAGAAALVLLIFKIRAAAAQHAVWTGVLVVMMALPLWILWGPKAALPILPAREEAIVLRTDTSVHVGPSAIPATVETTVPASKPMVWNWGTVLIGAYLLGVAALLLRLIIGTVRANRLTGDSCATPVTVGVLRPRVILPNHWQEWPQEQLDAILTHEQEHTRRRDPLVQWLALLNRALFWFHPLAWWLERRLSALAEEACDAAVLARGHDPQSYSEWLLEMARAVQRSGARVSTIGMSMPGSYLPHRVRKMIAGVGAPRVSVTRLICAAVVCTICTALSLATTLEHVAHVQLPYKPQSQAQIETIRSSPSQSEQVNSARRALLAQSAKTSAPSSTSNSPSSKASPHFDAASVKPAIVPNGINISGNSMTGSNREQVMSLRSTGGPGTNDPGRIYYPLVSLKGLLMRAYDSYFEIKAPTWLDTEVVQVEATMPSQTTKEQFREMLGNLITERFNLKYHVETKEIDGYVLLVGKNGTKLKESTEVPPPPEANSQTPRPLPPIQVGPDGFRVLPPGANFGFASLPDGRARIVGRYQPIEQLAKGLGSLLNCPVIDATGLKAKYDFTVNYAGGFGPDGPYAKPLTAPDGLTNATADPTGLSDIFAALESQLGLRLERKKIPQRIMIVDQMDRKPSEN